MVNIENALKASDSQDHNNTKFPIINLNSRNSSNVDNVKCYCGKNATVYET